MKNDPALIWSIVAAVAGIAAVVATVVYGEIQRRMARKQLGLAQAEAELRPRLSVSLRQIAHQLRPENAGWPHDKVAIVFDLTNGGRKAAHNVRCDVRLDVRHFAPDAVHRAKHPYTNRHFGPSETVAVQLNVEVLHYGPTKARYTCVCDEVRSRKVRSRSRFEKGIRWRTGSLGAERGEWPVGTRTAPLRTPSPSPWGRR